MLSPPRIAFTLRKTLGPVLLAAGALALAQSTREERIREAAVEVLVPVVEGGLRPGGYVDGRPIPSGYVAPIIIRWQPRQIADAAL